MISNGDFLDYVVRPDSDGVHIAALNAGMIYAEGKYWWYGEAFLPLAVAEGGGPTGTGVVMYSSADLNTWENEGVVLPCQESGELMPPMRFERPKVIYNDKTGRFVMWCHLVGHPGRHSIEPGKADAGVASCDTVNGTYQ